MRIQYNGESKILKRLAELVNRSQNIALRQDTTDKNVLYWTDLDGVEITINIPSGSVEVDAELSETSTNPVENRAITKELAQKADKSAIPTVGDGVLSVQRNGKSVGTFSANAAEDASVNISVPEKVSELENDAGYGTYTKPATGIPKSDLASGVQASLGKADTALQKHQDISGKLDKTGDASNTTVTFTAASARENVKTGEKLSVIVGKIAKWFGDLKAVAFTGSYNDLANKPTIPDISGKQDKLTAGANITLSGNTISAKDTTYSNATTSKAGLMSATDKTNLNANTLARHTHSNKATLDKLTDAQLTKLDGIDPDLYLPKAGGVMTGDIDLASNGVDLLVGTQRAVQGTYASAVAGATVAAKEPLKTGLPKRKSLIGSWLDQNSAWHSILSVRHRNGWNDGPSYGFYLRSLLTSNGNLCWNKQTGVDKWQGERVLLDSINYSSYAAPLSHTHRDIDQIGNVGYYGSDEANSDGWYKIYSGTLTGHADRVARLSIVRGYGRGHGIVLFHLRCDNSSSIKIHDLLWETRYKFDENHIAIKTNKNEYGIYVYQNSVQWGRIKVRVLESCGTSSNWTMTISNNSTKESSFTPTATGKDGSTVAKANEADTLTETVWTDVPETNISPRYGKNIKYLKSGNTVYVRGSISFSASLNNPCCGTMPSDLLPDDYQDHVFTAWNLKGGVPTAYPVVLGTDGKIILMNPTSTANWFEAGRAYNFNFNYHIG